MDRTRNRFMKWVSALGAVALMTGVLAVSASADIGASAGPVETDAPDLLETTIDGDDVLFCFDEGLDDDDLGAANLFEVRGYDDAIVSEASDVDVDDDDDNCARATFDNGDRALEDFTIGTAEEGAVENDNGDANTAQSAALEGSTVDSDEGQTTAPNLVDVESEDDLTLRYTFDDDVDCDNIADATDAANFGFYESDGTRQDGDSISDCDDNEVEVDFILGPGEDVDDGERFFVDNDNGSGEVCTEDDSNGTRNCTELESFGEDTTRADLRDAERTDDDEVEFDFDTDLDEDSDTESLFYVYEEDGTEHDADDCTTTGSGERTVRCTFNDIDGTDDFEIVLACADQNAVQDDDDTDPSTIGCAPIGTSAATPGLTDAPDLEGCEFGVDEGADDDELVNFVFDEPVDDDDTDESEFQTIDDEGDESGSNDIEDHTDNTVEVRFDESQVEDAVGCSVTDFDFDDLLGNFNSTAAVGRGAGGSGSPTTGTTTTATTTTTTTTTTSTTSPVPAKRRVATNVSKPDYANNRFRGSVNSSVKRCQQHRSMKLKKHVPGKNRVVGRRTSGRSGNYKFLKRNADGRYYVVAAKKKFTNRKGTMIVCRRDKSPTAVVR